MTIFRSRAAVSLAALAALSFTAAPALARGPDRGPHRWHGHHRGNGISGGDVLAGLLVVGGVAAIATAVNNSNNAKNAGNDEPVDGRAPEGRGESYGSEPAFVPGESADQGGAAYPGGPVGQEAADDRADDRADDAADDGARDQGGSLGGAVDACEAELQRGDKQVDTVDGARRMGDRYSVEGKLRDGRAFACSVDDTGHIRSVAVDGHAMV
jgi:hypothetical protein